jgi:hypothetical protein
VKQCRVFSFDSNGHIGAPPKIIECTDDREAMERAVVLLTEQCIE